MNDAYLHFFKVDGREHVYDTRSNLIFESSSHDIQKIRKSLDIIYKEKWDTGIDDVSIHGVKYPYGRDAILDHLRNDMEYLILGITDRCNLRCGYCIYSGSYKKMRTHRNVDMDENIARVAIDEFAIRSKRKEIVNLGFYGGEPLIKWNMINDLVAYAIEKMGGRKVIPTITTNGWLLTPEKFDFLRKNNFMILVSLDGPKDVHDRNRRTVRNKPTYDRIMHNMELFQSWNPEYYKNHVMFSYVIEDVFDTVKIDNFFSSNPLTRKQFTIGGLVNPYGNNLELRAIDTLKDKKKSKDIFDNVLRRFHKYLSGRENGIGIGVSMFSVALKRIRDRPITLINNFTPTSGICIPGRRKLLVTTDGSYHPCEKSESFNLGDVYDGFSEEKSIDLLHRYEQMSQGLCDECWAVRLCPSCYVSGSSGEELSIDRQKDNCESVKSIINNSLSLYVQLLEEGIDLSDKFQEIDEKIEINS